MPKDDQTYSLGNNADILIPLAIPKDPDNQFVFVGWENGENEYLPNQKVNLADLVADGGTVTFTAQWESLETAEQIPFTIQIVNDEDITETPLAVFSARAPKNAPFVLDVNSNTIQTWFNSNPEYELAEDNVLYYEHINNGDVVTLYVTEKKVTIYYEVPGGYGSVSPTSEQVKIKTGEAQGSVPTPTQGYEFEGWYTDVTCSKKVPDEWVDDITHELTPQQPADGMWQEVHYYAKFKPAKFELTITKTIQGGGTPEQDFLFWIIDNDNAENKIPVLMKASDFTGGSQSVTITLPSGSYTVEEDTTYSWKYKLVDGCPGTQTVNSTMTVTFTNELKKNDPGDKWLTGDAEINNIFEKTQSSSGDPVTLNNMDAILPTPTIPKEDGSDEDQPDNDQPDDLPEMTNAEGGAEHV